MEANNKIAKSRLWTSYTLQGLVTIMFLMGAANNLMQTDVAVNGAAELGYPKAAVFYLGVILLISTLAYALPRTSILGASLLTAWLGGAIATHIIHSDPFYNMLFPVIFGMIIWLSIWLRNEKLRALLPFNK
jgi:uncharacterized membrane protein (UPF0182 family)